MLFSDMNIVGILLQMYGSESDTKVMTALSGCISICW